MVTSEVAKHRTFMFLDWPEELIDGSVMAIASADAFSLGVLSSWIHCTWADSTGGRMGVGNDPRYQGGPCFDPFPFPALEEGELKGRIRELGKKLDAHRKERQGLHPGLTLTGMYNVLEKLRADEQLSDKDKKIHIEGLVSILKQIHDDLDAAVFEAYGWEDLHHAIEEAKKGTIVDMETGTPVLTEMVDGADWDAIMREQRDLLEQELLTRLVALNHERAAEEKRGLVRWLRPEYQAPEESKVSKLEQKEIELEAGKSGAAAVVLPEKLKWPTSTAAQFAEVRKLLPATGPDASIIAAVFGKRTKARVNQIEEILETLRSLGKLE